MKYLVRMMAVVLGLAIAPSLALADAPSPKERPENPNIVAGRKSMDAKDYKTAVGHFSKAVQELPNDSDAHNLLGYSYRKVGTFDKSMEHYQRALKLDANNRGAHEYLGELYLDLNQPDNAEKQLATLKKACPFFGKCEEFEDLKKAIDGYKAKKK